MLFQSPRSGKFVSNELAELLRDIDLSYKGFQSSRSGKFVSDGVQPMTMPTGFMFQSPRSGKFVSDHLASAEARGLNLEVSIP